ncbi:MAG: TolC family protein, partial [Gemmatimonadales bacterium]|nr:TolC family protein [Gemmatimonadales bacterium]
GSVLPNISTNARYARNIEVQQAFLPAFLFDDTAPPDLLVPVRFGSDNTWSAGISVEQPLFELDVFIGLGAASRFRAVENEHYRGTAQRVVSLVRQAYFNALLAAEEVRLTRETIERTRQSLAETQGLNRAGLASNYDVLRLEVQLSNLEPNLLRAEQRAAAAARTLLVEMGLDPRADIALEGSLNELDLEDPGTNDPANARLLALAGTAGTTELAPTDLNRTALEQRSDIRELRLNADVRQAQLASQRSEYFPKLSIFGSYDITAQQDDPLNFFGSSLQRTTAAVVGMRVELPIFQGFQRAARMSQTRAVIDQIDAQVRRLEQQASSDIQTLTDQVGETRLRAIAQRRAVEQAERGFQIASAEYREGVGSQLQVTDAEVALRQSEFNYAQAVYDYLTALASLDAAVGTAPESLAELDRLEETGGLN